MNPTPKWYLPVTIVALLWNLVGCAALYQDLMLTPEDIRRMSGAWRGALYGISSNQALNAFRRISGAGDCAEGALPSVIQANANLILNRHGAFSQTKKPAGEAGLMRS
jgi:hypothetical protein